MADESPLFIVIVRVDPKVWKKRFAPMLRREIRESRTSLRCLAEHLKLSPSYLSKVARGLATPGEETIRRIADIFDGLYFDGCSLSRELQKEHDRCNN